jgi:outer membrane receptor protein involved in Fe transport
VASARRSLFQLSKALVSLLTHEFFILQARMKTFFLFLFLMFNAAALIAQKSALSGIVRDAVTGEALVGAIVMVEGTGMGTTTDLDGRFKLEVQAGKYTFIVSLISYHPVKLTNKEILPGQTLREDIVLESNAKGLEEFTIVAEVTRESEIGLIIERKNAVMVFDGLSAEHIRKTPDRTTADVLKRVSGATIQDNSFVVVRGLPDRYNMALINGAPLPSSEPDRKAFSFDIFPAALISDLRIIKTAMPSYSGEFAGGIVQIKTRDIPEEDFYQVNVGLTLNTITTLRPFTQGEGAGLDFLGIQSGSRLLPEAIPSIEEFNALQSPNIQRSELVRLAQEMPANYATSTQNARPGMSLQFSTGHKRNLLSIAKQSPEKLLNFGSIFAFTYNNTLNYREVERNDFNNVEQTKSFIDNQYTTQVNWGALWNLALMHANKASANKISLKNIFNNSSFNQFIFRTGTEPDLNLDNKSYNYFFSQNLVASSQLEGEHLIKRINLKIDWLAGINMLNRSIPDYRIVEYKRPMGQEEFPFAIPLSNTVQPDKAGRFFSTQNDLMGIGGLNLSIPFLLGASRHELKTGLFISQRNRDFQGRQFGYVRYMNSTFNPAIAAYSPESLFVPENMGETGLMLREVTRKSDAYQFEAALRATYLQMESGFFENKLKFVYGLRIEQYRQQLNTFQLANDQEPVAIDTTFLNWLPSVNVIWNLHKNINLRGAWSFTVNRPEARELAPFAFYDFSLFALVSGNQELKPTHVQNFDLRAEYYPKPGQVISLTGFYKTFQNPIEKQLFPVLNRKFTYLNASSAYAMGLEFEFRMEWKSLFPTLKTPVLADLGFVGNLALIRSEVSLDSLGFAGENRPMQGQAPLIVNAGIQYTPKWWNGLFSLSANYIGRSIYTIGDVTYPSIWENPRWVIDAQISRKFLKNKIELKINARDLLASDWIFYQDSNLSGAFEAKSDNLMIRHRLGQQISFSFGLLF